MPELEPLAPVRASGTARFLAYFARLGAFGANARFYLWGTLLLGIGQGATWVHMNLFYRESGLGEEMIGIILSTGSLGTVLCAIPAAIWIDRFPAQRVFSAASIGFGLVVMLMLIFPQTPVLLWGALLSSSLFTVHHIAAPPFFMRNAGTDERIYLFGFANAIETAATIVGALGVGFLARIWTVSLGNGLDGLRYALLGAMILSTLSALPYLRIRSAPPEKAARSLRDYFFTDNRLLLWKLTLPAALVGMGAGLIIPFLNLYFRDRFHQGPEQIGIYFAVSQALTVVGFLAGPPVARRIGSVTACVLTEVLSIPFFLLLAVADSLPMAVFAFWMRGALMNMNHPISQNFAMEVVAPHQQTVLNSMRSLAWNGSWMISTRIGGWLIQEHGFTLPMLITISLYAISAALFWRFFGSWRRPQAGQRPDAMKAAQ